MNIRRISLVLLALLPIVAFGQKKPLTHDDYDAWKSLSQSSITDDGEWIKYVINPQEGDGNLYLYNVNSKSLENFERGYGASFSPDNKFFAYLVKPEFDITRQAKKDKKKADEMPKNNLGIKVLPSGETTLIERVKSFKVFEEKGAWIAYLLEKPLPKKKEKTDAAEETEETEETKEAPAEGRRPAGMRAGRNGGKAEGTEFVIFNPLTSAKHSFKNVVEYAIAKDGDKIGFVQSTTDSTKVKNFTVSLFSVSDETVKEIFKGDGELKKLSISDNGAAQAFIFTTDTSDVKVYDLYLANNESAQKIVSIDTPGMVEGWSVSENGNITFSESGKRLLFGTADMPVEEPEDELLPDEKYKLDIWSWHDPLLQPQQKINLNREKKANYLAVYHIDDKRMVQLADKELPSVRILMKNDGDLAVGTSNLKYRKMSSWESTRYTDQYMVDVKTGKRTMLLEAAPSSVVYSPSGEQLVFWCIKTRSWKALPTAGGEIVDLTSKLGVAFHNELHDSPSEPSPYSRSLKWFEGEKYVLINDRFDIWKVDVSGKEAPINITNGFGRKNNLRFTYTSLEAGAGGRFGRSGSSDKIYIEMKEKIYLTSFNYYTKDDGLYTLKVNKAANPTKIVSGPFAYGSVTKAKDVDKLIFTKGDYANYAELHLSNLKLENPIKISETNPQQKDFNWGTNELVEWRSFDGQMLQGILYKPENFDPNKKYPMIAYFYERSSDGLHRYSAPAPSASTINRTYAVSNGYLIFVPDIPYIEGYPGHSAYNAVVSGTYAMLDQFDFIDPDRLGLDGQSWGGYQIAYLITQTDLYTCAFSGAPVSNMTSAYGGIRWGSGMSRMFQYEKTQSRIGGTLWEKPLHYIENSPIFYVPNINTPVLIMHNDADGSVPWYQGIEFFVALRRLEKPAWLLSYNDEDHNLRKRPNRKDLSVRKMQFFDHYLQNAPAPYWMEKGISQLEKGKKDGYELMK
ncbi:MAG: prolyl oligopeptidase family serine peptidase [Bacteroidales bacterium]|nr:prolyl oligopeptidase family serine peptidase [Bacteroidales bacterium]